MRKQVLTPDKIPALVERMRAWDTITFDCETTSVDAWARDTKVLGVGLAPLHGDEHFYLPIQHHEVQLNRLDLRPVFDIMEDKPLVGHNIKFDLHMISRLGWQGHQDKFMDVIVMARLWMVEEHPDLQLEFLADYLLKYKYQSDLKQYRKRLEDFSISQVGNYCIEDVYCTRMIYLLLREHLPEHLLKLFAQECKLTRDLFDMERRGFMIDEQYLEKASDKLADTSQDLLSEIRTVSHSPEFNPRSTPQVRQLMTDIGIQPVATSEKTGLASWDRDACVEVRHQHPVAMNLAKYRALKYQESGMIQRCWDACKVEPVLHFEFKNWGTVTGRLSGDSQQMPKGWLQFGSEGAGEDVLVWARGDLALEREFSIRRLLCPRPGHMLIVADYKQIEMFVLGYYMGDPTFTRWLESGNVHAAVAFDVWGIGEDHPQFQTYYDRGKVFNFANVYGQGDRSLAKLNDWEVEEAKQYRQEYFSHMPGHGQLLKRVRTKLRKQGHVGDYYRREYHVDPERAYVAVNWIVQGSSGDYVKFQLPETRKIREQLGCHVLNTTHDDFVMEIPIENMAGLPDLFAALRKSPFKRDLEMDVEQSLVSLVDLEPYKELAT